MKTIVIAGVLISTVAVVSVGTVLWFAHQDYRQAIMREHFADTVVTAAFELTTLTGDYILHREVRAATQWVRRHESLGQLLRNPGFRPEAGDRTISALRRDHSVAGKFFARASKLAVENHGGGNSREATANLNKRLMTALLTATQAIVSHASLLSKRNRLALEEAVERTTRLTLGLVLLLTALLLGLWLVVARRVVSPIGKLKTGIDAFGRGDLDHHLPARHADEIGEVATAFNEMAGRLRETLVSRDELAKEVAERKRAEEEIVSKSTLLDTTFENMSQGIRVLDADLRLVACNKKFIELHEYPPDFIRLGMPLEDFVRFRVERGDRGPVDVEEYVRKRVEAKRRPVADRRENDLPNGRTALAYHEPMPNGGWVSTYTDITERKKTEEEIAEKSTLLETTFESMNQGIIVYDSEPKLLAFNRRYVDLLGYPPDLVRVGMPLEEIIRFQAERGDFGLGDVEEHVKKRVRARRQGVGASLIERELDSGTVITVHREPMPDGIYVTTYTDITEHRRAEEAIRSSETRLRGILENVADGVVTIDEQNRIESFNLAAESMFGYAADEAIGQDVTILMAEPDHGRHQDYLQSRLDTDNAKISAISPREITGRRKDGSRFPLELAVAEMYLGERRIFVSAMRDISDRKATEEQLRQAQKMEAVGQLTGGVAHDFNNLLAVIQGNLELIAERIKADRITRNRIETALRATTRGANLTQQLLAFSRQQPLNPEPTDINSLIEQMVELLDRTLTETITLKTSFAEDLWNTSVDRGQLETSILNLAINARDAMPEGGRLIIETSNVILDEDDTERHDNIQAGPYVLLAISDTGAGMAPEVVERAFEPFFTTKETGGGTGLGLSMVYGFSKQSGGHAEIHSEVGRGTTVKVYLPKSATAEIMDEQGETVPTTVGNCSETVLLVEDDADVRQSTQVLLESFGYTVVAAEDGREALAKLGDTPDVALLLTDIVLPGGMSGTDLAEEVSKCRPEIRALYMSGYTAAAAIGDGTLTPGVNFIPKPFRRTALEQAVRRMLDREEA